MKKTKVLTMRVDPQAFREINRMARCEGLSVSALIRERVLGDEKLEGQKAGKVMTSEKQV